ncbi:MAG: hypothetical protein N838_25975 [Thiohalocapsa sp. PB-PSB1]|nr:MAG: hypothetical protein N838_25975 [Thiohalocapsa sp. PB-PSB1]
MIKSLAVYDPEYMVEALQKALPFANIPGVDLARLTEIQQKNQATLEGVARMELELISQTAEKEFKMLEQLMNEMFGAVKDVSVTDNPLDVSAKQTELAVRTMDKLSQETADLIKDVGSKQMDIVKSMAKRYVDAIEEMKAMAKSG